MGVFNLEYCLEQLAILNEKKSSEEYARESFKKKHNFVQEKPNGNKNIGNITDKDGKKYRINMDNTKEIKDCLGRPYKRTTAADSEDPRKTIYLDKDFFQLKGSNKGERREAILNHEIGHQKLHNTNPNSDSVDDKNKTMKVFKKSITDSDKQVTGVDITKDEHQIDSYGKPVNPSHNFRKRYFDLKGADEYAAQASSNSKERITQRNKDLETAKKYEKKDNTHATAIEFEADRYAANHTSASALKKGLRELNKKSQKEMEDGDTKKEEAKAKEEDYLARKKALEDKDLKKSDTYK